MINQIKIIIKRIRYSKASLLIAISFALFTDMVCYGIILPIMPLEMENKYHKSQVVTGFLFAMFSLGCLIGTPIVGIASDRIGRKIPFLIGMLMLALSTILFAYGHYLVILFIARFVQGLSSAVAWVIGLSMIADIFPNDQFGTASGTVIGGNTIGALIGPIIGGVTYNHFGYVVPFYISALFAIVDLLIRLLLVSDKALIQFKKEKELNQNLIDNQQQQQQQQQQQINNNHKNNNNSSSSNKKQNSKYNKLNNDDIDEEEQIELDLVDYKQHQQHNNNNNNNELNNSSNDKFNQEIIQDNNHQINDNSNNSSNSNEFDGASFISLNKTPPTPSYLSNIKSSTSSMDKSEIINYNDLDSDGNEIENSNSLDDNNNNIIIINNNNQSNNLESINLNEDSNNNQNNNNNNNILASIKSIQMNEEKDFYINALKRKDVGILLVLIVLFAVGLSCLEPILPLIIEKKFHRSTSITSLLFAMFTLPFLLLSPIAGWLTDNNYIRRTKMTFIGAIISSICFPFIYKTSHLAVLFIVIILIGSGLALFFSPIVPLLTYVLDPKSVGNNNGKILSLFCVFYSVGICIGPVFSTVVVQLSTWAFTLSYSIILMISTVIFNIYYMNKSTSNLENFN